MSKLTTKERSKLPKKDFAVPGQKAYAIPDKNHAKVALAFVDRWGTPAQKAAVKSKVAKKYPGLEKKSK